MKTQPGAAVPHDFRGFYMIVHFESISNLSGKKIQMRSLSLKRLPSN
jgi:hypothetical protein